ncbi:Head binding [Klebsiella pneumoniae]|uniref:Head binding n=1 Tax=Klebsiella pneumoniae TaxID=573 RepID=A0A377XEH2_KLEPN|nr:Head binding [Klebsiella pneumoniae]
MTDTNYLVSMPSAPFSTPRAFKSVTNGRIYIGQPDTDPTIPENQIPVYVVNEDGSEVQISQPVVINAGGFPVYNGQIMKFVTKQNFSMAVYDAHGVQQFYWPDISQLDPSVAIKEIDELRSNLGSSEGLGLVWAVLEPGRTEECRISVFRSTNFCRGAYYRHGARWRYFLLSFAY